MQYFSEDEKILVVSGTHGDSGIETQFGVSGLTDKDKLDHEFYKEDCKLVGIEPEPVQKDHKNTIFCLWIISVIILYFSPSSLLGYSILLCICVTVPLYLK